MAFNILGLNHKTAPLALREKVAFGEDRLVAALRALRQEHGVAEVVILTTCNRTEVYWAGSASGAELSLWLEQHHTNGLDLAAIDDDAGAVGKDLHRPLTPIDDEPGCGRDPNVIGQGVGRSARIVSFIGGRPSPRFVAGRQATRSRYRPATGFRGCRN